MRPGLAPDLERRVKTFQSTKENKKWEMSHKIFYCILLESVVSVHSLAQDHNPHNGENHLPLNHINVEILYQ